jgi:aspartate/methionine/tyrosine aminotransferase
MSAPQTLARPLAARVGGLPAPAEPNEAPPVPQGVIAAAEAALEAGKTHYTDRPGILPLREYAVAWLGRTYGVEVPAEAVTITIGATEARFVCVKQLVAAGTGLAVVQHHPAIAAAAALAGVPLATASDDPAAISAVYLTPADAMEQTHALLQLAAARGWWVIWDTTRPTPAFSANTVTEIRQDDAPRRSEQGAAFHPAQDGTLAAQVVTLGSLSDALPGWRVGFMAGSKAAGKLRAYKQSMTICSPSVSQWAALGLEDGR